MAGKRRIADLVLPKSSSLAVSTAASCARRSDAVPEHGAHRRARAVGVGGGTMTEARRTKAPAFAAGAAETGGSSTRNFWGNADTFDDEPELIRPSDEAHHDAAVARAAPTARRLDPVAVAAFAADLPAGRGDGGRTRRGVRLLDDEDDDADDDHGLSGTVTRTTTTRNSSTTYEDRDAPEGPDGDTELRDRGDYRSRAAASAGPCDVANRHHALFDHVGITGKAVFDLGCGGGDLSVALATRVPDGGVVGVDFDATKVKLRRRPKPPPRASTPTSSVVARRGRHDRAENLRPVRRDIRTIRPHTPTGSCRRIAAHDGAARAGEDVLMVETIDFRGHFCEPPSSSRSTATSSSTRRPRRAQGV